MLTNQFNEIDDKEKFEEIANLAVIDLGQSAIEQTPMPPSSKSQAELTKSLKSSSIPGKDPASAICHELRTSIHGIIGNVEFINSLSDDLEKLLLTAENQAITPKLKDLLLSRISSQKAALHTVDICVKHQKVLTDGVLNLSKLEAGKLELNLSPQDPKKIIKEVVAMLNTEIEKKQLQIYLNFLYEDNMYNIDPDRLKQILLNLLSNAIKFSPERGEITLSLTKPEIKDGKATLSFSIKDNGIGMTEAEIERVFTPYSQANARVSAEYGGSGLGLSISKKLIELMGGKIKVISTKGQGAKFQFTINCPHIVEQEDKPVSPLIFTKLKHSISQGKKILIVEDNSINQVIAKRYLEQVGYQCDIANNGQEAVELCCKYYFDVILMDIEMPVMDGLEATRRIRAREASLSGVLPSTIISLSANVPTNEFQEALHDAGANACLTKPFDKTKLLETIAFHSHKTIAPKLA